MTRPPATSTWPAVPLPAYARDASAYDKRTGSFGRYRREVVDRLPLRRGDVVIDVGCGTGLCFAQIEERIGPDGTIVGVDVAPDMLAVASERATAAGWSNVVLVEATVAEAELPVADHALFCAVHDVLQSASAVDHVVAHVRPGGGVAAGGGKWAPPWALAVNASVLALHAPYVRDFTGFDRPWELLAERVPGLGVREVAMGGGYVAAGTVSAEWEPPPG
jgi:demethylmenaquinone methyltransferase/2-methoxy-6-polyprenyl-1,4-benzoquinol methylase